MKHRLLLLLASLGACAAPLTAHAPDATLTSKASVEEVEDRWSRRATVGHGVQLHATLWDAELLAAQDPRRSTAAEVAASERARWRAMYLSRTSFLVAIDVADRQPVRRKADDDLLELAAWDFRLDRGSARGVRPEEVELVGIDRYPTVGGDHHHRLVIRVHFPGSLHEAAKASPGGLEVALRVRAAAKMGFRPALGEGSSRLGFALRWNVSSG